MSTAIRDELKRIGDALEAMVALHRQTDARIAALDEAATKRSAELMESRRRQEQREVEFHERVTRKPREPREPWQGDDVNSGDL